MPWGSAWLDGGPGVLGPDLIGLPCPPTPTRAEPGLQPDVWPVTKQFLASLGVASKYTEEQLQAAFLKAVNDKDGPPSGEGWGGEGVGGLPRGCLRDRGGGRRMHGKPGPHARGSARACRATRHPPDGAPADARVSRPRRRRGAERGGSGGVPGPAERDAEHLLLHGRGGAARGAGRAGRGAGRAARTARRAERASARPARRRGQHRAARAAAVGGGGRGRGPRPDRLVRGSDRGAIGVHALARRRAGSPRQAPHGRAARRRPRRKQPRRAGRAVRRAGAARAGHPGLAGA